MTDERRIGNELEGSGSGLMEVLSRHLPGGTENQAPPDVPTIFGFKEENCKDLHNRCTYITGFRLLQRFAVTAHSIFGRWHSVNILPPFYLLFRGYHHPKPNISNVVEPIKLRKLRWVRHVTRIRDT
jgi:hypothetical protein